LHFKETSDYRWGTYFMKHGIDCNAFWTKHLKSKQRKILFIVGLGFDPRMCIGAERLLKLDPNSVKNILLIRYDEGKTSPSHAYQELTKLNYDKIHSFASFGCQIHEEVIEMISSDGRRIGSRKAVDVIDQYRIAEYTDVIVDISAMPRSIYFPIIAKILYLVDNNQKETSVSVNIHVLVAEQSVVDKRISEDGIDNLATYMHGFSSALVQAATSKAPRIWLPILGEGKITQLENIHTLVHPDEICPVLPSPSLYPRRADDLIQEYRELLFDNYGVEPSNIIYASERNPFEVYRQLCSTIERYNNALQVLGGCKVVVSALSSKLLSVGALLAAYESKQKGYMIGIAHVEAHGYRIQGDIDPDTAELFTLWIAGDCYNA